MKYFNIQSVSKISGVSAHCIRAWEKRYEAIKPVRSDNGRRLYSETELNRLVLLGKLSQMGHTIGMIAHLNDQELNEMSDKLSEKGTFTTSFSPQALSLVEPSQYLKNILMSLHFYKLDVLTHELTKASCDLSPKQFALEIITPLVNKVGELVLSGKLSIAQEHTLSALVRFYIGKKIGEHYSGSKKFSIHFALATPPGEQHCIGLMLSGLLLANYGIDFVYLGEDLEGQTLAEASQAIGADYVLVGVSKAYQKYGKVDINQYLKELCSGLDLKKKVWVGGNSDQIAWHSLGSQVNAVGGLEEFCQRLENLTEQINLNQ